MVRVFRQGEDTEELEAGDLSAERISAIDSDIRLKILEKVSESPTFPAEIARELDIEKQRTYYHFRKLEETGIIEKIGEKNYSGGTAQVYESRFDALVKEIGSRGDPAFLPDNDPGITNFLNPIVKNGRINGKIVVGSSERHGEDQVRAQDGHLAGEISAKLGNYGEADDSIVVLDTQLHRTENFDQNLIVLGGILTNTVAKKYNGEFSVRFSGESFPYREIETPEKTYEEPRIGFIAKTDHPEDEDKFIYMIAGIRRRGTRAAVRAFRDIQEIVSDYRSGDFYAVVEGMDRSGDGRIDSYSLLESGF